MIRPFLTMSIEAGGPGDDAAREVAAYLLCRQFDRDYRVKDLDGPTTASLDSNFAGRTYAYSARGACAVLATVGEGTDSPQGTAWEQAREPMALVVRAELEYLLWELQRSDTGEVRGLPEYPTSYLPFWKRAGAGSSWWTTTRIMLGLERNEADSKFEDSLMSLEAQQKRLLEHRLHHQVVSASTEPEQEASFAACRAGLGLERLERHADRSSEEISEYLEQVESRREAAMQALFGRMGVLLAFVGLMLALTDVTQNAVPDGWAWKTGVAAVMVVIGIAAVARWYRRPS
jgi:hypothetical protein